MIKNLIHRILTPVAGFLSPRDQLPGATRSRHFYSQHEASVVAERDKWAATRANCAAACDMRGVARADRHIQAATAELLRVAQTAAKEAR